ncbi:hypothetical protein [Chryseobacterium indoltheticum]|uniref:Lipoprotein n=1 Tax=Chryseobacterium indoltheticum TaxID=254 RepID=A0A381FE16_9FLAO|nr:hypothetical protein [Chryseobacterium indoltheticum]AZA74153.1 hypothetical protein EG358_10480 [Chryseobacterium indoltheticum]SIQ18879.1 hypothetical protein SAMN05421682_103105 [Chryseobacterium indoltheticum]SUX44800.1 Uncharacterised protein [Chryseobacterium indoltheticum]
MKNILITIFIVVLSSCNKNPEITEVVENKKIIAEIDRFIEDSDKKNKEKFMVVSGFHDSQKQKIDLLFTNQKPVIITENTARYNDEIKNSKYGYFTYKNYEFLVSDKMKSVFKLDYKNFDAMKKHFTVKKNFATKEEAMKSKWRTMYMRLNTAKDSVEQSNISEISLSDYSR